MVLGNVLAWRAGRGLGCREGKRSQGKGFDAKVSFCSLVSLSHPHFFFYAFVLVHMGGICPIILMLAFRFRFSVSFFLCISSISTCKPHPCLHTLTKIITTDSHIQIPNHTVGPAPSPSRSTLALNPSLEPEPQATQPTLPSFSTTPPSNSCCSRTTTYVYVSTARR